MVFVFFCSSVQVNWNMTSFIFLISLVVFLRVSGCWAQAVSKGKRRSSVDSKEINSWWFSVSTPHGPTDDCGGASGGQRERPAWTLVLVPSWLLCNGLLVWAEGYKLQRGGGCQQRGTRSHSFESWKRRKREHHVPLQSNLYTHSPWTIFYNFECKEFFISGWNYHISKLIDINPAPPPPCQYFTNSIWTDSLYTKTQFTFWE